MNSFIWAAILSGSLALIFAITRYKGQKEWEKAEMNMMGACVVEHPITTLFMFILSWAIFYIPFLLGIVMFKYFNIL